MKKVLISSLSILLAGILLGGCGNSQGKKQSTENRNSSLKAENSSLRENIKKNSNNVSSSDRQNSNDQSEAPKSETSTSSDSSVQGSSSGPIQSAQDAENLITHSMHVNPGIYHAVPTTGGFIVSRDDIPGSAFVQNNGNVTWDDGSTTSYGEASAPTNNQ